MTSHPFSFHRGVWKSPNLLRSTNDTFLKLPVEEIDRVAHIENNKFRQQYFLKNKPLVITDLAKLWPAFGKWDFEYFYNLAGADADVTIEHGNVIQAETNLSRLSLRDYIANVLLRPNANSSLGHAVPYASLIQILDIFPQLAADIDFSLLNHLMINTYCFGWIGPGNTVVGFHIDWVHNLLAQIYGTKRVTLVSPRFNKNMYPLAKYDFRSRLSAIEPTCWDQEMHPLFSQVSVVDICLEPGHVLYIPPGWWHRVESLAPSISINNFGHDFLGLFRYQLPAKLQQGLHNLGLWQHGNCTCHPTKKTVS